MKGRVVVIVVLAARQLQAAPNKTTLKRCLLD
jgi:hypothetical protein